MSEILVALMTIVFVIAVAYMVTHIDGGTGQSFKPPRLPKNAKPPRGDE